MAYSPAILADRSATLLFLCPRPNDCPGVSRRIRFADRAPELLGPTPLLVAEFGGYLAAEGSLLADIEGDGEELDELIPLVFIPGGTGRFILEERDCVTVAEGAISPICRAQAISKF
jgi:hypothetical protein